MLFKSNNPNFDGFGIIANSGFSVPEAFIIKDIANQNTFNNSFDANEWEHNSNLHHSSYYNYNNTLWDEEDEREENDYNEYNDYEEEEYDE